jgi:hypothetical protein
VYFRPLFSNSGCQPNDPSPCPITEGLVVDDSLLPAGTTVVPQVYDNNGKPLGNMIVCPPAGCSLYLLFYVSASAPVPLPVGTNWYVDTHEIFGSQIGGETHIYFGISGLTPPKPSPTPCTSGAQGTPGPDLTKPIRLLYPAGNPVLAFGGLPIVRPDDGHNPQFFINLGESASHISSLTNLFLFVQNGAWDEQRFNGINYKNFVDYATVSIGLYAAASGTPEDTILKIEDIYAQLNSHYLADTQFDMTYTHLPERNVYNTTLGYQIYQSNAFKLCSLP